MTTTPGTARVQAVGKLRGRLTPEAVDLVAGVVRDAESGPRTLAATVRNMLAAGDTDQALAAIAGVLTAAAVDALPMAPSTRLNLAAFGLAIADLSDQLHAGRPDTETDT